MLFIDLNPMNVFFRLCLCSKFLIHNKTEGPAKQKISMNSRIYEAAFRVDDLGFRSHVQIVLPFKPIEQKVVLF
jgi:hypothetical protein